ncbi:MAG: dicarboxylate/amino acid:cation symporter [Tenericutes bacterium]|nr:dicarboxylate/amino acid:cation symporter [Mycoplasmatota bacterium]
MKKFLKNYKSTLILLGSIIIGTIVGLVFKEKAKVLAPFGDLFLNLLLVIIVPLIFLTITTSIGKMKQPKRIGKILVTILLVFIFTSLVSVAVGIVSTKAFKLVDVKDTEAIKEVLKNTTEVTDEKVNFLERTVETITVSDFSNLLTRDNMIALIIFSILFGISINISKGKGDKLLDVLESANEVVQSFIKVIMYYAPIGLGCYFAALVGTFGGEIAVGYGKTFIIYTLVAILYYFAIYSLYAFMAGGKKGFINYWKNVLPVTLTSLATCSSAASIPVNTACAKNIGVPEDVADTTIPLGTSFHKDGSIIGSVFKIMFLVYLFNADVSTIKVLGVALLATLLVTAVPIGGGTISEMLIITMLGFPVAALPILTIIATIIDPPATMLNVVGDTASSMMVARITDGKKWLKEKKLI